VRQVFTNRRGCEIYWASTRVVTAAHHNLLSPSERRRSGRFRRHEDRQRFVLATALLRVAAGAWLRRAPREVVVDRTCDRCGEPHGPPGLPGSGLYASISHAGEYAAVALSDVAPVGVDVERIGRVAFGPLLGAVCSPEERRHVRSEADFYAYWTRKESVLKATRVGLSMPMREVVVTPPGDAPRVLFYGSRPDFAARMHDWRLGAGYACALTVLGNSPTPPRTGRAEWLLD
jgi:4'-phosphopantetheinyl transferase